MLADLPARTPVSDELRSILIGTLGLDAAALAALTLTLGRGPACVGRAQLHSTMRLALAVVLLQAAHFAEELATGFHSRFPELLGLAPWSPAFFVTFNVFWLVVWVLGAYGLSRRLHAALFPLWFLAIACLTNALVHPLLALWAGGYFPGLVTSPLLGVLGALLLHRLLRVTGGSAGAATGRRALKRNQSRGSREGRGAAGR